MGGSFALGPPISNGGGMVGKGTVKRVQDCVGTGLAGPPARLGGSTGFVTFTVGPRGPAGRSLRYTCITVIGLTAAARAGFETRLDVDRLVRAVSERRREITNPG